MSSTDRTLPDEAPDNCNQDAKIEFSDLMKEFVITSWLRGSAASGSVEAALRLAYRQQDEQPREALTWFEFVASNGNREGMRGAGLIHERGVGLDQDLEKAAAWYAQAAERGDVEAQFLLGRLLVLGYANGDMAMGYHWFTVAALSGHEGAIEFRDIMRQKMTEAQIQNAEDLTAEWSRCGSLMN